LGLLVVFAIYITSSVVWLTEELTSPAVSY